MFRKALAALCLLLPGIAHADWHVATSRHFVVYSDDSADRVKAFTTRLERFDKAIRLWHLTPEDKRGASARVTIYVVSDLSQLQKLAGSDTVAGFYIPRAAASVAFIPRNSGRGSDYGLSAQAILFHEYTHHWMLTNWADAAFPPWFVEGFAELHATAMIRDDGSVIFGAPPSYRRFTVDRMNLLPAARLVRPNPGKLDDEQRDALYSRGWLLTHYLTFDEARRGQLAAYIGAINAGKSIDEASALLGDISSLDFKLNSYGKRPRFASAAFTAEQTAPGEIAVRPLSAAETAIMPAFILSNRGVSQDSAPRVADLARRTAAAWPGDAFVQNELAEAEFDTGNYPAAEAAATRALAADPKSVHAALYRGMALVEMARKDKSSDPARWAAARRWFISANKADTEDPRPLIAFYDSFADAGQPATPNAQTGLLYAYALAPYDGDLRMKAAQVYLRQGKTAEARIALGPVAYNLDRPGPAAFAQKILAALDTGGAEAGLKELAAQQQAAREAAKAPAKEK